MAVKRARAKAPGIRRQVAGWGLPPAWVPIVVACLLATPVKDLAAVEFFAGEKSVAIGCAAHGLAAATIELLDGQDITTPRGQRQCIRYLCRARRGGLCWLGVPCSSWIFCGMPNAGRYAWCVAGDPNSPYAQKHNELARISIDLARLAFFLGLYVVIEQPMTSTLFGFQPMAAAVFEMGLSRVGVWLDGFGAASQKPLQLFGNAPWLPNLHSLSARLHKTAALPQQKLATTTVKENGKISVTGNRLAMEESSAYPKRFGFHVGRLHAELLLGPPAPAPVFSLMLDD